MARCVICDWSEFGDSVSNIDESQYRYIIRQKDGDICNVCAHEISVAVLEVDLGETDIDEVLEYLKKMEKDG